MGGIIGELFGTSPEQKGTAQTPGQARLQGLLYPYIEYGVNKGYSGQQLYPTPQLPSTPSAQGYDVPDMYNIPNTYNVPNFWNPQSAPAPQAPFSSPADFAQGYTPIINSLLEPYGDALGNTRGFSGSGENVLGSVIAERLAPQIMSQYTQSLLPYQQMAFQQGQNQYLGALQQATNQAQAQLGANQQGYNAQLAANQLGYTSQLGANQYLAQAQNQMGTLGYQGGLQQYGTQAQALASPWNLTNMYSGTYGSPLVAEQGIFKRGATSIGTWFGE